MFNTTFTDPTKKIYYPRTWGGKTALERYEDMKQQFWYIGLGLLISIICGALWVFLIYTYIVFIKFLWRISKQQQDHPQRIPHEEYLQTGYIVRWVILGIILFGSTIFFCTIETTRNGLLYGVSFWSIVLIFKSQVTWILEKLKNWAWRDQLKHLHQD